MDSTDTMNLNSSNHITQPINSSSYIFSILSLGSSHNSPTQMWQNNYTNISDELHLPATEFSEVDLLTQQMASMNVGGESANTNGNDGHSNVSLLDVNYYYYPPPYSYSMQYFPYSRRTTSQANYNRSNNLPKVAKSALYKTELCKNFNNSGYCRYGDMCQFAHGTDQLRKANKNHQNNVNEIDGSSATTAPTTANTTTTATTTTPPAVTESSDIITSTTNNNNTNQNNSEYRNNNYHPRQYNNNNNRLAYSNFQNNNNNNNNNGGNYRNHRHYNNYNQVGNNNNNNVNRKYTSQNVVSDINDWPPLPPPTNQDNNNNNNSNVGTTTVTATTTNVVATPTAWINKPIN